MTFYVEEQAAFVRCEIRDCGPGEGWELCVTERRLDDGVGHYATRLVSDSHHLSALPSESWRSGYGRAASLVRHGA